MHSPFKKPKSKEGDINQQLSNTIYIKVTKKTHNHESPKKNGDGTIKKCIELFKQGADPNVLIELEKSLKEQEEYHGYYIKNFLPILKDEVIKSEALAVSTVFGNEREQLQRSPTRRGKILEIISGIIKRSSNKDSKIEEQPINSIKKEIPVSSTGMTENNVESPTEEEVCASDLGSGMGSRELSATSTLSEGSLNSTEEDNGLQPEDEGETKLAHLTKTRAKGPSGRRSPSKHHERKDPMQPEEKEEKAVSSKQEASKDILSKKQSNNRNLHVALVAGCALSTIGCIVAGAMTSGLIGAGLLAMAAVFAIAAVAELHSNFLSSKLTSINVEPHVNDKELTACSRL